MDTFISVIVCGLVIGETCTHAYYCSSISAVTFFVTSKWETEEWNMIGHVLFGGDHT